MTYIYTIKVTGYRCILYVNSKITNRKLILKSKKRRKLIKNKRKFHNNLC